MMRDQSQPMDVNEWVIRNLLSNVSVIGLFMCPMITMRLFAEEKRTGTIELLITSPLNDYEIIIGKWLAAVLLYACMLGLSLLNVVTLYFYGKPDWKPMLIGYLGLLLQGACMLAIGTFISSCTRNQIVAVVASFGVFLLLWVISWASSLDQTPLMRAVGYLSILDHLDSLHQGRSGYQGHLLFLEHDFPGPVPDRTGHGIHPVEGIMAQQTNKHRAATLATAVGYAIVVVVILAGLNFLANRYNKSYDSTANKKFTLSDQTDKIAGNLKQDVKITYWGQSSGFTAERTTCWTATRTCPRKSTSEYQDVDKKRTQALAAGVKNPSIPMLYIFVEAGNKKEDAKGLTEEDITGAIVRVLKGGDRKVCFTAGSGEHSTDDTERDGFSTAKQLTEKNNYKTEVLRLLTQPQIPMDCTITVIPGPKHDYTAPEVNAIKEYVENGGRALILLDAPLKFAAMQIDDNVAFMDLLSSWGVTPDKDLVLDLSGVGQLYGVGPEMPVVMAYQQHAIVHDMKDTWTAFPLTRSLDVKNGDKTKVDKLFETTADSLGTTNLASASNRGSPLQDRQDGALHAGRGGHLHHWQGKWQRTFCGGRLLRFRFQRNYRIQRQSRSVPEYVELAQFRRGSDLHPSQGSHRQPAQYESAPGQHDVLLQRVRPSAADSRHRRERLVAAPVV